MARPGIYRDGKKWRIKSQVTINGEVFHIHKRGFETEGEAYNEKARIIYELNVQAKLGRFSSFGELVDIYFDYVKKKYKESTLYILKLLVNNHFGHLFKQNLIRICSYDRLEKIRLDISKKKISTDYKNKIIRRLKDILNYAINRGFLDNKSISNVRLVLIPFKDNKIKTAKEKKILTKDEYSAFLNVIPEYSRDRVLFALWGHTGLRIGEIRALQPKHIDIVNNRININQQAVSKLGTGKVLISSPKTIKSIRTIDVSKKIIKQLQDLITAFELDQEDFIFHGSSKDKPLSEHSIRYAQEKYSKLADVPYVTPHGIRHSNTTWLLSNIDSLDEIGEVSERLGHASKKITLDIYFHVKRKRNTSLLKIVDF